jgi:hypothetical protein
MVIKSLLGLGLLFYPGIQMANKLNLLQISEKIINSQFYLGYFL